MAKRTIALLLGITLLLLIRVSTHLTTNDSPSNLALPAAATAPHQLALAVTPPNQAPRLPSSSDSLSQLEAYLIPAANAAGDQGSRSSGPASLAMDDKTLTSLRSYKSTLDERQDKLDQREKELQQSEDKLHKRIAELEQLEASIQQRLKDEAGIKTKKIKRLTSVYEGMKANKAAPVIAQMQLSTVVKIFSLMDEKKVGKILSFLPAEKAVLISQALTKQISTVK
ncbi:MAG: hypothetical protein Q9M31_00260 [Mariprofundus sp.]|nr:hypothetical protein [Mariprofundus sp.]